MGIKNPLLLEATGITIDLHPNTEYKNFGVLNPEEFNNYLKNFKPSPLQGFFGKTTTGLCALSYGINSKYIISTMVIDGRDEEALIFDMGHEETHAMQYLGQLNKLYNETQKRGLEFEFFGKDYIVKSDVITGRIFNKIATKEDKEFYFEQEDSDFKEYLRREIIAHLGGHIAYENRFPNDEKYLESSRGGLELYNQEWMGRKNN